MNIKLLSSVLTLSCLPLAAKSAGGYVAHEWGTFTSVQGGDGVLLPWRPLESSRLPGFVYDWRHPGLDRRVTSDYVLGKGALISLQRMETPVIYFYASRPTTVDVAVDFPQGSITEWYPQATQIGPGAVIAPPFVGELDQVAHRAGIGQNFTFASWVNDHALKSSRVHWADVQVLPPTKHPELAALLPLDKSGSHYFAAREAESDFLRINSLSRTNPAPEHEKFLFYRGLGNFTTPLRVKMSQDGAVTMINEGKEPLRPLFVLELHNGLGRFVEVAELAVEGRRSIEAGAEATLRPVPAVSRQLGEAMARSLIQEGLYPREAQAMIDTWKDSWFAEDGVRVLYLLPRPWTQRTLPMTLQPAPRELVRVMVGRAEVIAPAMEQGLVRALAKAQAGDQKAQAEAK